jgi:signal transduction histidine kinase
MKLRNVAVVFTILVGLLFLMNYLQTKDPSYRTVDMISLNESYQQVLSELKNGEESEAVEEHYDCVILLKTDANYQSKVMAAMKERKILMDYEVDEVLLGRIAFSGEGELFNSFYAAVSKRMILGYVCALLAGYVLIGMIHHYYVRPFQKLKSFASEVAKGNLKAPLEMTKGNYFGVFTESFDIMREELQKAKDNEYRANVSKKELVAELSHDMKTPIATIKATCDVLKAKNLRQDQGTSDDMLDKLGMIEQKADMIDQLINNMFHATLEEMENLKVEPEEELSTSIVGMFDELKYYGTIKVLNEIPECLVYMDTLRLKQVIDNIVNNSYKYAGTQIDVSFQDQRDGIIVEIRDYGSGVSEEELPMVTEKYYRGKNGKGKSGAGLGLFLVKYFMENMKGGFECYTDHGFVVHLFIRKV